MFRYGVFSPNELNATDRSRPFGNSVDGNTSVRSLRCSRRDGWIVMIKAEWYRTVRDVTTFGPINQGVPNPIVFGEGRWNLGIGSHMQGGQEMRRTERFEFYF